MAKPMSHQTGIIIIVSDMGIYNGTKTGQQIDDAIDAVEGSVPTISQLVRDEVKAQLSEITGGVIEVAVFNSDIMRYMNLSIFATKIMASFIAYTATAVNANDYKTDIILTVYTAAFNDGATNFPVNKYGILIAKELKSSNSQNLVIQWYIPFNTTTIELYQRKCQNNGWDAWIGLT